MVTRSDKASLTQLSPELIQTQPLIHAVNGHLITDLPAGMEVAIFAMGCFWGVERLFWTQEGVWSTAAGYCGGHTSYPAYQAVCSGETGHAEAVRIVFDPHRIPYEQLLKLFWENHHPGQGLRQGNDIGSQYRSAIFCLSDSQYQQAWETLRRFQHAMAAAETEEEAITTTITTAPPFYYAEPEHQQYLHKHPAGYCGLKGTGIQLPPHG